MSSQIVKNYVFVNSTDNKLYKYFNENVVITPINDNKDPSGIILKIKQIITLYDNRILCVSDTNSIYTLDNLGSECWKKVYDDNSEIKIVSVAQMYNSAFIDKDIKDNIILGIGIDSKLYYKNGINLNWKLYPNRINGNFKCMMINNNNTIYLASDRSISYMLFNDSFNGTLKTLDIQLPNSSLTITSIFSDIENNLYVTLSNNVPYLIPYNKLPESLTSKTMIIFTSLNVLVPDSSMSKVKTCFILEDTIVKIGIYDTYLYRSSNGLRFSSYLTENNKRDSDNLVYKFKLINYGNYYNILSYGTPSGYISSDLSIKTVADSSCNLTIKRNKNYYNLFFENRILYLNLLYDNLSFNCSLDCYFNFNITPFDTDESTTNSCYTGIKQMIYNENRFDSLTKYYDYKLLELKKIFDNSKIAYEAKLKQHQDAAYLNGKPGPFNSVTDIYTIGNRIGSIVTKDGELATCYPWGTKTGSFIKNCSGSNSAFPEYPASCNSLNQISEPHAKILQECCKCGQFTEKNCLFCTGTGNNCGSGINNDPGTCSNYPRNDTYNTTHLAEKNRLKAVMDDAERTYNNFLTQKPVKQTVTQFCCQETILNDIKAGGNISINLDNVIKCGIDTSNTNNNNTTNNGTTAPSTTGLDLVSIDLKPEEIGGIVGGIIGLIILIIIIYYIVKRYKTSLIPVTTPVNSFGKNKLFNRF